MKFGCCYRRCHHRDVFLQLTGLAVIAAVLSPPSSTFTAFAAADADAAAADDAAAGKGEVQTNLSNWIHHINDTNRANYSAKTKQRCRPISEILCETDVFDSFCELLKDAGLDSVFEDQGGQWTVFAPTNTAFEKLGIETIESLMLPSPLSSSNNDTVISDNETDPLTDLLMFHIIPDQVLHGTDFGCDDVLMMGNGEETTILCGGGEGNNKIYQVGPGNNNDTTSNDKNNMVPQIAVTDVAACNGVIHVVNGVLLPSDDIFVVVEEEGPPSSPGISGISNNNLERPVVDCQSIQEVVCEMDILSTFCGFLDDEDVLKMTTTSTENTADADLLWTVFAPTDQAFEYAEDVLDGLDPNIVLDILKFHTVPGDELFSDDLVCESNVLMGNGQASFTSCSTYSGYIYQQGPGNMNPRQPRIIATDMPACNGVVHVVNRVLLPDF